jgi:NAD(P)H dehydrogenase (quinone)
MTDSLICMFGASGGLGSSVARQMAARGIRARLILRRAAGASASVHRVVRGDLDRPETLVGALMGVATLILITADGPKQSGQALAAVAAAKAAGVTRIVLVSAMLAGETPPLSFGVQHAGIEQALCSSGLESVILRPSFFMQSFGLFAGDIRRGRLMVPVPSGRVAFVDRDDVAEAVVACALQPGLAGPNPLILTGGTALDFPAVATLLSAATGTRVRHIALPLWLVRPILPVMAGLDRWTAARLVEMFAALEAGLESAISPDLGRLLGRAPATFEDFLAREQALFRA